MSSSIRNQIFNLPEGSHNGQSWSSYWTKRTDFWGKGRSGLTIPDIHGNDAKILVPHVNVTPTSYLKRTVANYAATLASGFVEAYVYVDQTNDLRVFASVDEGGNTTYLRFDINYLGKPFVAIRNGAIFTNVIYTADAVSVGWHKIKWLSTGSAYEFYVDELQVAVATSGNTGLNNGKWFDQVPLYRDSITIGYIPLFTPATSLDGKIAWVNFNDTSIWHLTGQGLYEYDQLTTDNSKYLTWVGTPLPIYGESGSQYYLNNGYTLYKKTGQLSEYVPNISLNTPQAVAPYPLTLAGYTKYVDRDGFTNKINLAPCLIDFDPDETGLLVNFDRSNTTIFEDAARAGSDYDASHPFRWRAKDIADPTIYYNWLKVGYKDKILSRITQEDLIILSLDEILSLK